MRCSVGVRLVSVLFAGSPTVYSSLVGVDVFDARRDARSFAFDSPVVAHPPCSQWSRMRGLAKGPASEKALGVYAVRVVQRCGGVLEHPEDSSLFAACSLPRVGHGADRFGGVVVRVFQGQWGHYAAKPTWLYIVGVRPELVRELLAGVVRHRGPGLVHQPGDVLVHGRRTGLVRDQASTLVRDQARVMGHVGDRRAKVEREATPLAFARLLVHLARSSRRPSL